MGRGWEGMDLFLEVVRIEWWQQGATGITGASSATSGGGSRHWTRRVLHFVHGFGNREHRNEAGVCAELVEPSRGQTDALVHVLDDERRRLVSDLVGITQTGTGGCVDGGKRTASSP